MPNDNLITKEQFLQAAKTFYYPFIKNHSNQIQDLYWIILNGLIDFRFYGVEFAELNEVPQTCRRAMLSLNAAIEN